MVKTLTTLLVAGLGSVAFLQTPTTAPPQLRTRVDLVTIDVTVLDGNRRPVTGLTAADFILLENGQPQEIRVLDAVSVEASESLAAGWLKAPPVDVAANRHDESRLFVLVIDDATLPMDPYMVRRAREMATAFIEGLGPTDLAAVVFTRDNRNAQDFTRDRARLLAAANRLSAGFLGGAAPVSVIGGRGAASTAPIVMDSSYYLSSLNTLGRVAEYLEAVPMRRKIVAYLSIGVPVSGAEAAAISLAGGDSLIAGEINQAMVASLRRTIDRAQRANVAIYGLDPAGLDGLESWYRRRPPLIPSPALFTESLLTLAGATGGRAFVNANDFKPGIAALFVETKSYYLLGYVPSPTPRPGDYRRIEVKTKRSGLDVISRKGYFTSRQGGPSAEPLAGGVKAISGVLPDPGVPLRAIAAPLLQTDATTAVALTLAVDRTALKSNAADTLEVFTYLFDPEGRARGNFKQTARLCAPAGWCEITSLIPVKPGRHAVRVGVKHVASGATGSVYLDVDVPDFTKRSVTASGLMLEVTPPGPRATDDRVGAQISAVPTTRREFANTDRAAVWFRIHQRRNRTPADVTRTLRIRNARDEEVATSTEIIPASTFTQGAAAEQRIDLTIDKLVPGRYLVSVGLALKGGEAIERQLSFSVR